MEHDQALDIFAENGAYVDRNHKIVKIPGYLVEDVSAHARQKYLLPGDPKMTYILKTTEYIFVLSA